MPKTPFRILIVDDDAVTRALLQDHFAGGEQEIVAVASAAAAMAVIESAPVQIVVADWLMPQVSGLDLLRWVRRRGQHSQPHFVMLTANTGREQLVEAFTAGVDDFLTKPFHEAELMARLKAWTRLVTLQDEASRLADQLRAANRQLVEIASNDELTGLANRRSARQQLEGLIQLASRHGHSLTCAWLDVDHFKHFNDRHGHAVGDRVLKHFADLLLRSTRSTDVCCRIGGDEFLVLLPHTSLPAASCWAEHLTHSLAITPVHHKDLTLPVRVSIGLANWVPPMTVDELLEAADRMLYDAKDAGRGSIRACG